MDIFYGVNLGFGFESDFNLTENYNINPRLGMSYKFNNNFSVNTTLLVNKELYQLKDKSSLAREGYLYDESVGASLGVTYSFDNSGSTGYSSPLYINFGIRSIFDRKFSAYNSSGDKMGDLEFDPSYGFYLDFNGRF